MSLDCVYKDIDFCHREFFTSEDCTCDTSLIVPDTKSDIVKILSLKTTPVIEDVKVEKERVIITGQVKFNLMYIGEDEKNRVCSITASTPFSHTITTPPTQNCIPMAKIICSKGQYNLTNSRKAYVQCVLCIGVTLYQTQRKKVLSSAPAAETKAKDITVFSPCSICTKSISITESLELPGNNSEIQCLLRTNAKISDYDYKILNNKAIVKGNVLVTALYLTQDDISTSSATIPFTEVVEAEGLSPSNETKISLSVADCDALVDTDLSGAYKLLDVSLLLTAHITSFKKETIKCVTDIFLPKGCIKTESVQIKPENSLEKEDKEEFIKESCTLNPTMPPFSKITDVDFSITDVSSSDNLITAMVSVNIMYVSNNSSRVNVHTEKIAVSHKAIKKPTDITAVIKHSGFAMTSDTSLETRLSLIFSYTLTDCEALSVFTHCEETEYTPPKRSSVIVSFVKEGDSLWSIAKRYNIPLSKLAMANAMEENAILEIGEKLIIPR